MEADKVQGCLPDTDLSGSGRRACYATGQLRKCDCLVQITLKYLLIYKLKYRYLAVHMQ